jgi:hypothetical protein
MSGTLVLRVSMFFYFRPVKSLVKFLKEPIILSIQYKGGVKSEQY